MNPSYFGDSYDLVKRFFCAELSALRYSIAVNPMFAGTWHGSERDFYRLIGVYTVSGQGQGSVRTVLFLDPDTGVHSKPSKQHVSLEQLATEALRYTLVFSFDHSFSRSSKPEVAMRAKLSCMRALGRHAMYYNSHARFLFVATKELVLQELQNHLVSLGMPASRLLVSEA